MNFIFYSIIIDLNEVKNNSTMQPYFRIKFSDIREEVDSNNYDSIDDVISKYPQLETKQINFSTFNTKRLNSNRLSCEELENLKERFVDFLQLDESLQSPDLKPTKFGTIYKQNKASKSCAHLSQLQKSSLSINRPDPPQRTVSIRHSTVYSSPPYDDNCSLKSAYSSCLTSTTSSSCSSASSCNPQSRLNRSFYSIYDESALLFKTEALIEEDINRIEAMYKSVNSIVLVSTCTVDVYTTNTEQISNLQEFWKLEFNSVVPVWIFDRKKQLKLTFVDKQTAFPVCKQIIFTDMNQLKNPKEKRLTFNVKHLTFLIVFHDFFACNQFLKFYQEFSTFNEKVSSFDKAKTRTTYKTAEFKSAHLKLVETKPLKIKKSFISNPCAFQHVNSLKNEDKQVKMLIKK